MHGTAVTRQPRSRLRSTVYCRFNCSRSCALCLNLLSRGLGRCKYGVRAPRPLNQKCECATSTRPEGQVRPQETAHHRTRITAPSSVRTVFTDPCSLCVCVRGGASEASETRCPLSSHTVTIAPPDYRPARPPRLRGLSRLCGRSLCSSCLFSAQRADVAPVPAA